MWDYFNFYSTLIFIFLQYLYLFSDHMCKIPVLPTICPRFFHTWAKREESYLFCGSSTHTFPALHSLKQFITDNDKIFIIFAVF